MHLLVVVTMLLTTVLEAVINFLTAFFRRFVNTCFKQFHLLRVQTFWLGDCSD